ncbi:MAG: peptidoglycan editing factor PgeF [Patescibacteria group bacterium]|nr:peptidoglycan editing factor PgeF [Patescibacteria group bacterium]
MSFAPFQNFAGLRCGLSERADGPMNLKLQAGEPEAAYAANRQNFFSKIGLADAAVVFAVSYHKANVVKVGASEYGQRLDDVDGLVSNEPGTFLALTVADCVPVFLFDPRKNAWGIAHAGWRGIATGVVPLAVKSMIKNFGSRPEDIHLATGPAIQKCHFEVKADVLKKFKAYPEQIIENNGATMLDLPGIVSKQAQAVGILSNHIETSGECTFCLTKRYFSYRRDQIIPLKTMFAYIGR